MEIKAIPTEEFYSAKSEINRSSVKVHASRNDGNKTSMMNPEDISTPGKFKITLGQLCH